MHGSLALTSGGWQVRGQAALICVTAGRLLESTGLVVAGVRTHLDAAKHLILSGVLHVLT